LKAAASRELLAPREDVWRFIGEPRHLSDWWPGIAAVRPDRRGLAPGARWELVGSAQPGLFRKGGATALLIVKEVLPYEGLSWHIVRDRLDVDVRLHAVDPTRTLVTVRVEGPWRPEVLGRPRALPRIALDRLHALCQTAASM
jgi:uncharacterized protein YndB with AHSA1/START domain